MPLCYAMLCYALQRAVSKLIYLAKPHQPIDMMTRWSWLIPLRETSLIALLLMGIHGMGLIMGLPTTTTITTTMALIDKA